MIGDRRSAGKTSDGNYDRNMTDDYRRFASPGTRQREASQPASILPSVAALVLALAVNFMVLKHLQVAVVRPILGFWFILIFPSYLLFTTSAWRRCGLQERIGYSVGAVLLTLMLSGLAINEVLPLAGVSRPLTAGPIVLVGDLINLSLYIVRSRYPDRVSLRIDFGKFSKQEVRLLVVAALAVILAVFGANHLNNGGSGNVTLIALMLVAVVGIGSIRWLASTRESIISVVIYLVAVTLLLSTSLRGWYVTGHDIQQEYLVFQLTEAHGHWSMAYFRDAYNACLSITILPTELGQILNIDSPYVFKLFFQLIFALSPVLAYATFRRFFNRGISTLGVAYFVGFPTFFTDEPFLNRQEMALVFVAVGLLAATNPVWSSRRRKLSLCVVGLGIEISHYSTMYVFVGSLVIGLIFSYVMRPFIKPGPTGTGTSVARRGRTASPGRWHPAMKSVVSLGVVATFLGIVFLWGTLATQTTSQIVSAGKTAISQGAVEISGFPGASYPVNYVIDNYRKEGQLARAASAPGTYLPWSAVSKAATPIIDEPLTPLTSLGRALNSVGIPVSTLNSLARMFVADGEELFLFVGLLRMLIEGCRRKRVLGGQFFWLAIGCTGMIVLINVLPSISADYGVLRAFQQGLLFFAPMIVIGSMTIFAPIGMYWGRIAACLVCLGVFLSTSTVLPQVLGNNLAELNLNNTGSYYDLYYTTAQETAAKLWLGGQPDVLHYPIQVSWDARRFYLTTPNVVSGSEALTDQYPTLVYQDSWVILGGATTSSGVSFSYDPASGDTFEYKYPTGLLGTYKNLVYTNGGAVIYK